MGFAQLRRAQPSLQTGTEGSMRLSLFYQIQVPKPWTAESEAQRIYEALEQIPFAEQRGFSAVWFSEHHFRPVWSHNSAPDLTLAAVSQRTERIRLGIGVVLAPLHPPLHIAQRAASRRADDRSFLPGRPTGRGFAWHRTGRVVHRAAARAGAARLARLRPCQCAARLPKLLCARPATRRRPPSWRTHTRRSARTG